MASVFSQTKSLNVYSVRRDWQHLPRTDELPPVFVDLERLCPTLVRQASGPVNATAATPSLPPRELLSHAEIREVCRAWHLFHCPPAPRNDTLQPVAEAYRRTCTFEGLGQHLLHAAARADKSLLTVQVGAMDGTSNDPMYAAFVPGHPYYKQLLPAVNNDAAAAARHWLPILFEPVPSNYEKLIKHYSDLSQQHGVCSMPVHAAVNFQAGGDGKCAFCRVNTADDAPEVCQQLPDWMKDQIGSLDCEYQKKFHEERFEPCVLQDPLPCGVLGELLRREGGIDAATAPLAILQIDIEGYEYKLLQNYLLSDARLPHAIHYEYKVMAQLDGGYKRMPLNGTQTRNQIVENLLHARGYTLWLEGEDVLALRL